MATGSTDLGLQRDFAVIIVVTKAYNCQNRQFNCPVVVKLLADL